MLIGKQETLSEGQLSVIGQWSEPSMSGRMEACDGGGEVVRDHEVIDPPAGVAVRPGPVDQGIGPVLSG